MRARSRKFGSGPVEGGDDGRGQLAGLVGHAVEPPLGRHDAAVGAAFAGQFVEGGVGGLQQLLAVGEQAAGLRQLGLLARLGLRRRELGDGVAQIFLIAARARQRRLGLYPRRGTRPPLPPVVADLGRLVGEAAEGIEHGAVVGAVEQALLLELAFDLHQRLADAAEEGDADGLVVDEGAAAAVGAELAAEDDVAVVGQALLVEQRAHGMVGGDRELGADAGLPGAGAEQLQVGAAAEGQAERIQEDRFAGARLAGQHGEAGIDLEIQAVDEDDVADRQVQQHRRSAPGIRTPR